MPGACPEGWLSCPGDKRCLAARYLCDGNADCIQAEDERLAQCRVACQTGSFYCETASGGRCLKNWRRCDKWKDCKDGSDELSCPTPAKDSSMTCTTRIGFGQSVGRERVSVSRQAKCDGFFDCPNSSDEMNCKSCPYTNTTFFCDGFCHPMARWCDKLKDCRDGSDEAECLFTTTTSTTTTTTTESPSTTTDVPPTTEIEPATSSDAAEKSVTSGLSGSLNVSMSETSDTAGHGSYPPGVGNVALYTGIALVALLVLVGVATGACVWRKKQYRVAEREAGVVSLSNTLYVEDITNDSFDRNAFQASGPLLVLSQPTC